VEACLEVAHKASLDAQSPLMATSVPAQ
jgi:hypothetical protein